MRTSRYLPSTILSAVSLAIGLLLFHSYAVAYPDKPVVFVVPFGPGGPSDLNVRLMQPYFKKVTGQELVIENRPGAGGAVGWSQLNRMSDDGYRVMLTATPHIIFQPIVNRPAGYETEDLTNVIMYAYLPQVIGVSSTSRFKSVAQLVEAAKAKPGGMTIAGTGVGGGNHVGQAMFDKAAGITTVYVPFKDTASTNAATMGNQVDASWTWLSQGIMQKDRLRMLAIAADERFSAFPDVPTLKELGYDVVTGAWNMIAVPKGVSEEMRKTISATFARVFAEKEFQAKMAEAGFFTRLVTYPEVKSFVAKQTAEYRSLAETLMPKKAPR